MMNNKINAFSQQYNRRKHAMTYTSVHPGGGFVALPDGSSSTLSQSSFDKVCERRAAGRKGFVAWPGKA